MPQAPKIQKSISKMTSKMKKPVNSGVSNSNLAKTGVLPDNPDDIKRKGELDGMLAKLNTASNAVKSQAIIGQNKLKQDKFKLLQQLFAILEDKGVDVNDMESINQFLQGLAYQDPDLLALFEYAFNGALGEEAGPNAPTEPPVDMGVGTSGTSRKPMMERFSNLTQSAMMPRSGPSAPPAPAPSPAPAPAIPPVSPMPPA
jgi:hypothetical protein